MGKRIMITGLGFAIPETLVTTEEVCSWIGVPEKVQYFEQSFLMHERPLWWKNGKPKKVEWPGTTLGISAGRDALAMAGIKPDAVTHLILISCTPDVNHFQADVYRIMRHLGLLRASCSHINLGCGGIAPALYQASVLLGTGAAANVLIVATNSTSPFMARRKQYVATKEWFSLAMFNDSAGALLLSAIDDECVGLPRELRKTVLHKPVYDGVKRAPDEPDTFAHLFIADDDEERSGSLLAAMVMESGVEPLMHVHGGGANAPTSPDVLYRLHGGPVAERYGPVMLATIDILARETPSYQPTTARLTAVHQANGQVVKQLRNALAIGEEPHRLPVRTWQLGNSVSASTIEVALDALKNHRLCDGDIVAFVTIGAGMSSGGAIFRWGSA